MEARTARSWAIFCMALWLMGAVSMAVVATQDFYTIDRLLEAPPHPTFAADVQKLGHDAARDLLRYLSSELNRLFFQYWNLAQLAIGILALWLVVKLPGADKPKWGIVAMLAIAVFVIALIALTLWMGVGGGMVIFLAGLQGVPTELKDAAQIDGANRWETFRFITLPLLTPVVFFQLILGIIVTLWLTKLKD